MTLCDLIGEIPGFRGFKDLREKWIDKGDKLFQEIRGKSAAPIQNYMYGRMNERALGKTLAEIVLDYKDKIIKHTGSSPPGAELPMLGGIVGYVVGQVNSHFSELYLGVGDLLSEVLPESFFALGVLGGVYAANAYRKALGKQIKGKIKRLLNYKYAMIEIARDYVKKTVANARDGVIGAGPIDDENVKETMKFLDDRFKYDINHIQGTQSRITRKYYALGALLLAAGNLGPDVYSVIGGALFFIGSVSHLTQLDMQRENF
jgi:hypothetical protein